MIGFDVGTYNLVCCKRDKKNHFVHRREVNAFIEMPLDNRFVFNMMKKSGVPLIEMEDDKKAYALGEKAVDMAYAMNAVDLKRPMYGGCLNPKEKHAQQIMSIMMQSLIGEISEDGEALYYSVPANAVNSDTDADYHTHVLNAIFRSFRDDQGRGVTPHPINEALALAYAELEPQMYTGIAVSCGAGMVNLCYAMMGNPLFSFAIVNSGDWIDKQAARATGESIAFINKEKQKLDLTEKTDSLVMNALKAQYEIMIAHTVTQIRKGLDQAGNKARNPNGATDIVIAGGTSSPRGFDDLFREKILEAKLPIEIGEVRRPEDPLYSVARGCLVAAENAQD